ncbi:MAG: glutathione S-transferase family protein [Roseitalea sp.]|jgi:glutathione S-transferase|nr:glutathione S-transferase family protein [Roseitalea sp.]MBO6722468.1 glutathione S-transferase family protein [Roseitalea sp.]MBO6742988.1 glutathione S-transferase family protein [Roseitalea sp.]
MTDFTLYGFWESGNAYKVALMLELCDADWAIERVAFFTGETRRPEFRALNVMGEVPVLIHHRADGDFAITQSGACLTYLAKHFGRFGPETEAEEYDVLRWLLFDSQKMSGFAGPLRFLRTFAGKSEGDDTAFLHGRLMAALKALDAQLEGRDFILGDRPSIADLACQGYLHWPEQIGIAFDDRPHVAAWLERIRALPGFKRSEDLMPSGREPETATA